MGQRQVQFWNKSEIFKNQIKVIIHISYSVNFFKMTTSSINQIKNIYPLE